MAFCALSTDQHKSLYKLIYKNILESKSFDLNQFAKDLHDKVLAATKNSDLALTYASFVPTYVNNLQSEDKEFRTIIKSAKVDLNDLSDKVDEWENNIDQVSKDLGIVPTVSEQAEEPVSTPQEAKRVIDENVVRAQTRNDVMLIMKDKFGLPDVQASAVAAIYDRVAKAYAMRTGKTVEDFYKSIGFTTAQPGEGALNQIVGPKTISKGNSIINDLKVMNLNMAKKLTLEGKTPLQIFHATGWEKVDGQWKTEISYGNVKENSLESVKNDIAENDNHLSVKHLSEVFDAPELYKYYPGLKRVVLYVGDFGGSSEFAFNTDRKDDVVNISVDSSYLKNPKEFQYVLIHELQHYIQYKEGYITKDEATQVDAYLHDPLEIEANLASFRSTANEAGRSRESFTSSFLRSKVYSDSEDNTKTTLYQRDNSITDNGIDNKLNKLTIGNFKNAISQNIEKNGISKENINKVIELISKPSGRQVFEGTNYSKLKGIITQKQYESNEKFFVDLMMLSQNSKADGKTDNDRLSSEDVYNALIGASKADIDFYKNVLGLTNSEIEVLNSNPYASNHELTRDISLNQKNEGIAHGAATIAADGTAIIHALTDPNVSTPLHELAHVWEHYLTAEERTAILKWTGQDSIVGGGPAEWTRATSEQFARGFEKYLQEGKTTDHDMLDLFRQFKEWLTDIYKAIFSYQTNENAKYQVDRRDLGKVYGTIFKKAEKLRSQGKTNSEINDILGYYLDENNNLIHEGDNVSGSPIDLQLNDDMRRIYTTMLGSDYRQQTMDAINGEKSTEARLNKLIGKIHEDTVTGQDFMNPIPPDSTYYWGHLSVIQQAFLNKKYDKLLVEGKMSKEQLTAIINSTASLKYDNAGLSQELAEQTVFRVNNQDLIDNSDYWQEIPERTDGDFESWRRTVREIATNGSLIQAVQNDIVSPEKATAILVQAGQVAPAVYKVIKEKQKENEELNGQVEDVHDKAIEELTPNRQQIVDELKSEANNIYKKTKNLYLAPFNNKAATNEDIEGAIKSIAEQANDPNSYDPTVKLFGQSIVDKAQSLYPDATVGGENLMDKLDAALADKAKEEAAQVEDEKVNEMPPAPKDENILAGDTVDYKGTYLTVESISYGDTPEDNTYFLSDGSAKFGFQVTKVDSQALYDQQVKIFEQTAPNVFQTLETEYDANGNVKRHGELTKDKNEKDEALNYAGLKTLLDRLRTKFQGIDYEITRSDEDFVGRFKDGKVQINLNKYDITTPFHEYLHPFVAVLNKDNPALYDKLMDELKSTEEGFKYIEQVRNEPRYKNADENEIEEEALVRAIAKESSKNINREGRRIEKKYKTAFARLVDKFRSWFNDLFKSRASTWMLVTDDVKENKVTKYALSKIPIDSNLADIVDMVSLHDIKFDLTNRLDLLSKMEKYQDENAEAAKTYEEILLGKVKRKIAVLESTARERINNDALITEVVKLRGILKESDPVLSAAEYLREGMNSIENANTLFTELTHRLYAAKKDNDLTEDDLKRISSDLGVVKTLISMYKEATDYFVSSADKDMTDQEVQDYYKILGKKEAVLNQMDAVSRDIATEWLFPKVERVNNAIKDKYPDRVIKKEDFKRMLYSADADVDQAFYLLGSVGSSKDPVSAVIRDAIYQIVEENHIYETQSLEDIKIGYDKFLKNSGLENNKKQTIEAYKRNYLRKAKILVQTGIDEKRNPIMEYKDHWALHQEYNFDLFDKDRTDYMENKQVFGENGFDETNQQHVDKLLAWEKSNGVMEVIGEKDDVQNVYDADGKKTGEITVKVPLTRLKPNDNYRNDRYDSVKNDPFFQTLTKHYEKGNSTLGDKALKYGIVPQVSLGKNMFVDFKDKSAVEKVKILAGKTFNFFIAPKVEEDQNARNSVNLDGSIYRGINTEYTSLLAEEDLDLTLPETIAKFASASNLTSLKKETNALVDITKSIIEGNKDLHINERKILKTTSDRKPIFDRFLKTPQDIATQNKRLNQQLVEFINDVMYGEDSFQTNINVAGRAISLNKLSKNWTFLTALNNMALNVGGAVNNLALGKAQNFIEASGGRYFTTKNYVKGQSQYYSNINNFTKDGFALQKSIITQLGIKYDAIQGEFRDKFGKRFVGNVAERYANTDTIFMLNHIAEHEIQLTGMLALMDATKVMTNDGKQISLFDAHVINKDGFLRLRDDVKWTKQDDFDFTNRWHGINKRLNGNYSTFDKALMQRRWYGKLALVYRKFIYTSIRNRFTKDYTDFELKNVDYGYQRKFFAKIGSDIKEYKLDAVKKFFTKEGWTADEKQAYAKSMTEFAFLTGAFLLGSLIAHAEADEPPDSSKFAKTMLLYTTRFRNDIAMFTILGIPDVVRILQNPSAIMVTMTKYADFFTQLATNPTDTYTRKTGPFEKGSLKLTAKAYKALPLARQVVNLLSPDEQLAYYNVLKKGK